MPPRPRQSQPELAWAVGITELPTFVDDGIQPPFRPLLAAVVSGVGQVLGHGVAGPADPDAAVEDALRMAIGTTSSGLNPDSITVSKQRLQPVVERLLAGVPVRVGRSAMLETVFEVLPDLINGSEPQGIQGLETYLTADITPEAVASFFAACKELYERRPWTLFPNDQCWFSVSSQALGMRRWCGCVIGQEGESYGVLLFESKREQEQYFLAASLTDNLMVPPPGLLPDQRGISFEALHDLSPALAAEIAAHQWPIAAGESYPVPLHLDRDFLYVPGTKVELARLEAVAQALTRLIDRTDGLQDAWSSNAPRTLRKQFKLAIQNGEPLSVTITLLPPREVELS